MLVQHWTSFPSMFNSWDPPIDYKHQQNEYQTHRSLIYVLLYPTHKVHLCSFGVWCVWMTEVPLQLGKRHEILNSSNTTEPPRAAPSWLMFVWPLWWCLACGHTFSFPLLGSASGNQVYIKTIKSHTWQHATKGMTQQTGAVLETSNSSSNNIVNN